MLEDSSLPNTPTYNFLQSVIKRERTLHEKVLQSFQSFHQQLVTRWYHRQSVTGCNWVAKPIRDPGVKGLGLLVCILQ